MKAARLLLATASIVVVATAFALLTQHNEGAAYWSFPGLALLSAGFLWTRRSGLQIATRASWVSLLAFSTLAASCASGDEQTMGVIGVAGSSLALLAAGGIGLGKRDASLQPVAFHRSILFSLVVLAVGVQWLAVVSGVALTGFVSPTDVDVGTGALLFVSTLGLGFLGVLRLKVWGFVLTAVSCLGLVSLAGAFVAVAQRSDDMIALSIVGLLFAVPLLAAGRVLLACVTGVRRS